MKKMIANILLYFVSKLLGYNPESERIKLAESKFVIPEEVRAILPRVSELCDEQESSDRSGSWKRTSVMIQLLRDGIAKKDASIAIELSRRGIK